MAGLLHAVRQGGWLALLALLAVAVVGLLALRPALSGAVDTAIVGRAPCHGGPLLAAPVAFHFAPGLQEHQSWLELAIPEPDATDFSLCLDGRQWSTGVGETPSQGRVLVSVTTRWVDLQWALGQLEAYQDPARWQVRYTTYTLKNAAR